MNARFGKEKTRGIFMVRILLVLALILAVVAVIGFYRGWFHFSSGSDDNNAHVTVSVDNDQIQEDKDKVVDRVQDLGQQEKDKVATTTQ
jgi:multidrug efflux pump subunit AcrB